MDVAAAAHNVDAADGGTSFPSPLPNRPDRSSANRGSNRSAARLTRVRSGGESREVIIVSVVVNKRLFVAMAARRN